MIRGPKTRVLLLTASLALAASGAALGALTTDELTRLKASGLGEDVIRFMVESDYENVDRVVRLKEAGFSDETVSSVIRKDLKAGTEARRPADEPQPARPASPTAQPAAQAAVQSPSQPVAHSAAQPMAQPATPQAADAATLFSAAASVKIEQYLVRGEPVVQNSQDIPAATISMLEGRRLKIDWDPAKTPANFFRRKPFTPPFYWDLDRSDGLHAVSQRDNSFVLRTGHAHQGQPETGTARAWVLHITPESTELAGRIRAALGQ